MHAPARPIAASRSSFLKGLKSTATGANAASGPLTSSGSSAVMKTVGRSRPASTRVRLNAIPSIPGMFTSRTRHASRSGTPAASSASTLA